MLSCLSCLSGFVRISIFQRNVVKLKSRGGGGATTTLPIGSQTFFQDNHRVRVSSISLENLPNPETYRFRNENKYAIGQT